MPKFAFLAEIPMDKSHTLEQLTGRFQTVKDGLPELVKNAKDQYARLQVTEQDKRQIVVVANSRKQALAVIDFAGAASADFEGWQTWSSRTASQSERAADIEGGHGNGGKAFMVRGSTSHSYMDSCANGLRTRMGFDNKQSKLKYYPGYGMNEKGQRILDLKELKPRERLDELLTELGLGFSDLPKAAQEAFARRKAFTLVKVAGAREWVDKRKTTVQRLVQDIRESLSSHAQAALTIETCSVWVLADGKILGKGILVPAYPEPMPGFDALPPVPVPVVLVDPGTGESVATGAASGKEKYLQLRTSKKQLRMSDDLRALNVIRVRNERNIVANWAVAGLVPRAESAFILGELRVPSLVGEHLADSHRTDLADTPLSRALREWVTKQVEALSDKIAKAIGRETKKEDQDRARNALEQLRDLMRQYLEAEPLAPEEDSEEGDGPDGPGGKRKRKKGNKGYLGTTVTEIVLEPGRDHAAVAVGTEIPTVFRCYELDAEGNRHAVIGAKVEMVQPTGRFVDFDGSRGTLKAFREGEGLVWLRDTSTGTESNKLKVEALACSGVDIVGSAEPLLQGQRTKLLISFQTSTGPRDDLLVEGSVDEADLGRISRGGFFTAGLRQGTATIRVKYGPSRPDMGVAQAVIGSEVMPPTGKGGSGSDIPLILLCGTEAPGMDDYPQDQRTLAGGEYYPTIVEEPQFPQVVWINPSSKESLRVRQGRGGPAGTASVGTKTFLQFVALKCFDILKRLKVRQTLAGTAVQETEFTRQLAQAEMDCAGFIDAAYQLAEGLTKSGQVSE